MIEILKGQIHHELSFKKYKNRMNERILRNNFLDDIEAASEFVYLLIRSLYSSCETLKFESSNNDYVKRSLDFINKDITSFQITCGDFRDCIKKIATEDYNKFFCYCDPPYINTYNYASGGKKLTWTERDFDDLLSILLSYSGMLFAISEFSGGYAEKKANECGLFVTTVCERLNIKNRMTEILITNYKPISHNLFDNIEEFRQ